MALLVWNLLSMTARSVEVPKEKVVDGVTYQIAEADAVSVKIVWKDKQGRALENFPAAAKYLASEGFKTSVLMNGGIFEPGRIPSGLLIQGGKELNPVNRKQGKGNFFLQPNGIFMIGPEGAAVIETSEYPLKDWKVADAVQSGPLLLRKGKRHPKFNKNSKSRLHRNGVGVTKKGRVILVVTEFKSPKFPNLFEFAELFRSLGCEDALFLDGDLSDMVWGKDVHKRSNLYGSMIAVVEEE